MADDQAWHSGRTDLAEELFLKFVAPLLVQARGSSQVAYVGTLQHHLQHQGTLYAAASRTCSLKEPINQSIKEVQHQETLHVARGLATNAWQDMM